MTDDVRNHLPEAQPADTRRALGAARLTGTALPHSFFLLWRNFMDQTLYDKEQARDARSPAEQMFDAMYAAMTPFMGYGFSTDVQDYMDAIREDLVAMGVMRRGYGEALADQTVEQLGGTRFESRPDDEFPWRCSRCLEILSTEELTAHVCTPAEDAR